jgi:hypothetical protein
MIAYRSSSDYRQDLLLYNGGLSVIGTVTLSYGGAVAATGTSGADGTATASYGGAVVATGKRNPLGVAVAAYGSAVTATGVVSIVGVVSLSYGGAVVVTGTSGADGVSVVSYGGAVSATGTVTAVGVVAAVYVNAVEATGTAYLSRLILPTENTLSPLDVPKYHVASRSRNLARFMTPGGRQRNVWILTSGAVTTRQPADMSTVSRSILGGHVPPDDLSSEERTLLTDAGYSFERVQYA